MTTITKTVVAILAATAGAAATTKGAPGAASAWVDIGAYDGGDMFLSVLNGTAPAAAGVILIQASPDNGTTVYDYWACAGDLNTYNSGTLAGLVTNTIWVDPGVRYVRVIGYGNTTNPVTFAASFSGVTRA